MRLRDRLSLLWLAITGRPDNPRWLRERDIARDEVDRYRRCAELRLGAFLDACATVERIETRLRKADAMLRESAGRVAPS